MDRIIRLNAVEASSQSGCLEINLQDVHPCYALTPEMASIYGGSVASPEAVLSKLPRNIQTATTKTFQTGITSTSNYSRSLQKVLEQQPSIVPHLILLGGLAFFATVFTWACTGKIQQVTQVQGKFALSQQLAQPQPPRKSLYEPVDGVVSSLNNPSGEEVKPKQIIAEITPTDASPVLLTIQPSQKTAFVDRGDLVEIKLNVDSQPLELDKAGQSDRNHNILSGKVVSVSSDAQTDKKLGWVHHLQIALDGNNPTIKLTDGQVVTAKIIHNRRVADLFLRPIKELHNSESDF
ncbi:HlyD family secretion protein [Mastigocladus laminosus UU774]|nr:HlyD family secretion protein [Westiellopsis prolifica IICB1]TFI54732.1 HlyD family secretion protein [Mastigocladus laminosus UU774]